MEDNEPIRIAQIVGKLWAGGVENVVFNYYRKIDKSKFQFDFYYDEDSTVEPPRDLIDMGAFFFKVPPYQNLPSYIKILREHFRKKKYEIVHSHLNTLSIFPLYAAWREGVPVRIAHNHSVPGGGETRRNVLKYSLRTFAKIFPTDYFACSEKAGRWMFGNKAFNKDKVFVLKNAIDFSKFRHDEELAAKYRKKLGLTNKFVIGHVGRFTYAKNHKFLIDIFAEIRKRRNDAILLLVGDGELHEEIVNKLKLNELYDSVVFVGKVLSTGQYYQVIDVMIFPSLFEGLPLTTIESQIAGVPVVLSEAIPKEAEISDGCKYMRLSDSVNQWAEIAIKTKNKKIHLNKKSMDYDIDRAILRLQNWYLSKVGNNI